MEQEQCVEVVIHKLAREALQKRRADPNGVEWKLQNELETLRVEVKELMDRLSEDERDTLKTYIKKMQLLSEYDGDYLYFQGAKDCMELFEKLGKKNEKE